MSSLPKLPGYNFPDTSTVRFNLSQTFEICNGYKRPKNRCGDLATKSVKFATPSDAVSFDPRLIYGRCRTPAVPLFKPHFVLYDKKCLNFKAFFKQSIYDSPDEHYQIRVVNIIYFLEDGTITVMEPRVVNSGLNQGRLVRRGKILKNSSGDFWHWKDLNVGKNIAINGIVYHLVDCDTFTREYMTSQGLIMGQPEQVPNDPYFDERKSGNRLDSTQISSIDDKLGRFLRYGGIIFKFDALWDDRDSELGGLQRCQILYFPEDDTVTVKEIDSKDYPLLIKRIKLPKVWYDRPLDFPAIYLENDYQDIYQSRDFLIGETIFILGRKMLLIDCDDYTRNYYRQFLCIEQKPAIVVDDCSKTDISTQLPTSPPPPPPKEDVVRKILNAGKYLSYDMIMADIHPEDTIRKFILQYSLADGTCRIYEPPIRNSGFIGGRFLRNNPIQKPNTDRLNPEYYTPNDFYIGANITIFGHKFQIIAADLRVYRYMQTNPEKFSSEVIENVRNYMLNQGYLDEDIQEEIERLEDKEKQEKLDGMVDEGRIEKTELQQCFDKFGIDRDNEPQYIADNYVIPGKKQIPYGIKEVNLDCSYPPVLPEKPNVDCKTEEEKRKASDFDTPEQKMKKYYDGILRQQKALCDEKPRKSVTFAT